MKQHGMTGTTAHIYTDEELLKIYAKLIVLGYSESEAKRLMVSGYPESTGLMATI